MAWFDIGAYVFIAVIIAVAIVVLYQVLRVVWSGIEYGRESAKWRNHPTEAETPFGPFKRVENAWYFQGRAPLSISVANVDGVPDPGFVARLPEILARISYYDELAREAYDFEADLRELELEDRTYDLDGLSQGDDGEDFVLSFNVDEEGDDEIGTVFVSFRDGKVTGATLVH